MKAANTAVVRLDLGAEAAETTLRALEPDNGGVLSCRVEGDALVLECHSDKAMGVLRTLDDALDCVRALGEP